MDNRILLILNVAFLLILGWFMVTYPAWYRFLAFGLGYLGIGIISRTRPGFQILQVISGFGSSIAVWQSSPASGFSLFFIAFSVFLLQNRVFQSLSDGYWFFLCVGLSGLVVLLLEKSFHTFFPAICCIVIAGLSALSLRIAVYRLDREFRGDTR